ncbi:hypothetical protein K458DRAFT_419064 [Lentithecium fluviatile CBS 122367]|uniref:SnoaL-like domain-containing protein n=1 Tax=Lentithecium fluviatile CBS 122367 TaxID=1168545 RepID=A0A6G1IZT9_9PLEO|nr:hypothetical protein K458DRAFT_419064 [Lentithecium fluviatile CBS 122367]
MAQSIATNPLDHIAVQNVIARYCEALDTKVFSLLDKVFLSDAVADYPFNNDLKGVESVRDAIMNRLGPILTHHSLTTQLIQFSADCKTAYAVTYFIGCHFGQGPHEGKVLQAYGRYVDELVCLEAKAGDLEGVPGASGVWRIKRRTVGFTKRVGEEGIMREF